MQGNFGFFFWLSVVVFFFKLTFSINSLRKLPSVSNSLNPDQARQNVIPELDPNCLISSFSFLQQNDDIFLNSPQKHMLPVLNGSISMIHYE